MHGRPGQLPRYESSFVGREREIADLLGLLADHRLVSICGVGGSGKTRLAVEAARRLSEVEPGSGAERVVWTSLATVHEDSLVSQAIADELGIRGPSGSHSVADLSDALAAPPSLLVLDNCEQIVDGCVEVIAGLLTAAPDVRVLLTSRVPLHIATEQVYPIPALDVGGAALELFIDRAAVIAPVYALTDANRHPITEICARLEGLPLALELAASRIRVLSPRDLLHELTASLDVLRSTDPSLAVRHRSLKAVLSTTWRSLGEDQREVLAGLATFQGGFTPDAAEAVTGATPAMLHTLLDHALVQATTDRSGRSRHHLHELVRSFASDQSAGADPHRRDSLHRRHFDYFLALTKESRKQWSGGSVATDRRGPLWEERANLDAAMLWALDRGDSTRALLLVGALYIFWAFSWPSQNAKWDRLERALALPWQPSGDASILARARALISVGYCWTSVDSARAWPCFEEALRWYREVGHPTGVAWAHAAMGWQLIIDGDLVSASRHYRYSLALFRSLKHRSGELWCLSDLGQIAVAAGSWNEADRQIGLSMSLADEIDDVFHRYRGHLMLADVRRLTGRWQEAVAEYSLALEIQRGAGISAHGADVLEGLGAIAAQRAELDLAADLLAAGLAWRRRFEVTRGSFSETSYSAAVAHTQSHLGSEDWRQALNAAERLSPTSIEDLAASGITRLGATLDHLPAGLSEREVEVLRLVVQGLSNATIAERLVVSPRTVEAHLRSVFPKLGVTTRTAAAHEAVRLGILTQGSAVAGSVIPTVS